MNARSVRDWKRPLRWLTCCAAMISFAGLSAAGQQSDQLQEQLQQLKQQYDATTRDLEQRIASLQQQIGQEKEAREKEKEVREKEKAATVSAAALAEQAAQKAVLGESNQVGAKFQGQLASEPTYDLLRDADQKIEKLQEQLGTFEFHGYFRSGYGLNSAGGKISMELEGAELFLQLFD